MNGQEVLKLAKLRNDFTIPEGTFRIGLGAYNDSNNTIVRYRHVQVRQLSPPAAPKKR